MKSNSQTPEQIQATENLKTALEAKQELVPEVEERIIGDNRTPAQIMAPENLKTALRAKQERLMRRPEVEASTGLSRSTIYDWMKRGEFPQPVKLGNRIVAWKESDIAAWTEARETRVA